MDTIQTIKWDNNKVIMLDQRKLPTEEVYNTYEDYLGIAIAIETMVIRGAPAIGVAAAFGIALGAQGTGVNDFESFKFKINSICDRLAATRPTAVNLFWAIERMKTCMNANAEQPVEQIICKLKDEAINIYNDDISANQQMGKYGQQVLENGMGVLTHCNAGALATAGFGTAHGVIYAANHAGKQIHLNPDETRPRLQGAQLTAWELQKHGIQVTVITDNMMPSVMQAGKVQACIVGADRIAGNGDVANKIGTYGVAVLAHYHRIPFYVAAPLSTIDFNIHSGKDIPIEERDSSEVTHIGQTQITPDYVDIINPAFDVTPNHLISGIITEKGIVKPDYTENLSKLLA